MTRAGSRLRKTSVHKFCPSAMRRNAPRPRFRRLLKVQAAREGALMKITILISTLLLASTLAGADVQSPEIQIAAAILAAPAELREGAAVLGYNAQGNLVSLREGKNELICLASDPGKTA